MASRLLAEYLRQALDRRGSPVIGYRALDGSEVLSAANLWTRALQLRHHLRACGVRSGDAVRYVAGDLEAVVTFVACAIGGYVAWPQQHDFAVEVSKGGESGEQPSVWSYARGSAQRLAYPDEELHFILRTGATSGLALLLSTSGTRRPDGRGRLVGLSGAGLVHQVDVHLQHLGQEPSETRACILPHWHAFGLVLDLLTGLAAGQTIIMPRFSKFSPRLALSLIREEGIDRLAVTPRILALFVMALRDSVEARGVVSKTRVHVGGAPLDSALLADAREIFGEIVEGYGLTEAGPGVMLDWHPVGCEVKTVAVPGSNLRELWVKSPSLGIFCTDSASYHEGFYRTGDHCIEAEGILKVVGRAESMMKSSDGQWISKDELETRLITRFQCACIRLSLRALDGATLAYVLLKRGQEREALVPLIRSTISASTGLTTDIRVVEENDMLLERLSETPGKSLGEVFERFCLEDLTE